jgi:hypothetical protein
MWARGAPEAHESRKRSANRPVGRLPEKVNGIGQGVSRDKCDSAPATDHGGQPPSPSLALSGPEGRGPAARLYRAARLGGAPHSWWRRPASPSCGTRGSSPRGRFGGPPPTIFVSFASQTAGAWPKGLGIPFPTAPCAPGDLQSCLRYFNQQSLISATELAQLISGFSPVSSAMTEKQDREILALG